MSQGFKSNFIDVRIPDGALSAYGQKPSRAFNLQKSILREPGQYLAAAFYPKNVTEVI